MCRNIENGVRTIKLTPSEKIQKKKSEYGKNAKIAQISHL